MSVNNDPGVSPETLLEYVRQHIDRLDRKSIASLLTNPPESAEQQAEMRTDAEIGLQILHDRDDLRGADWIDKASEKVLSEVDYPRWPQAQADGFPSGGSGIWQILRTIQHNRHSRDIGGYGMCSALKTEMVHQHLQRVLGLQFGALVDGQGH